MKNRSGLLIITLLVLGASLAGAQSLKVTCIGDSITEGKPPFDDEKLGGYPGRLQPLLRQGGSQGAQVRNLGVGGDDTFEVLARIGTVPNSTDVLVLTAGTNDVDDLVAGRFTFDDTIGNLAFMLDFVESNGMRPIVGTLPPRQPDARHDRKSEWTYELVQRIRQMAHGRRWGLVDFWHLFPNREMSTFALYYYPGNEDVIGHPNSKGFEMMAEAAADVILEIDSQSPVDGRLRQPGPIDRVTADTDYEMELFDHDSGILLSSATLLINGEPLDTTVSGSPRKAVLFAAGDGRRRCKVMLSVRAQDRAEPPNELDFFISRFSTPRQLLIGDVNGDCRVDGRDLALFGSGFGKTPADPGFDVELDFAKNGSIDGDDFAQLAHNFGRGELAGGG